MIIKSKIPHFKENIEKIVLKKTKRKEKIKKSVGKLRGWKISFLKIPISKSPRENVKKDLFSFSNKGFSISIF